jgi:hypothetical protein
MNEHEITVRISETYDKVELHVNDTTYSYEPEHALKLSLAVLDAAHAHHVQHVEIMLEGENQTTLILTPEQAKLVGAAIAAAEDAVTEAAQLEF